MIFEIDEIPEEGLSFEGLEKKSVFEIDEPECALKEDVFISGILRKIGNEVYLSGKVRALLSLTCTRCLESFDFPVSTSLTAHYVPTKTERDDHLEIELHPEDIEIEYYEHNRIDLTHPVHDQILLAVPLIHLCKKDCRGLCPQCGKNLNLGPCDCKIKPAIDPRLEVLKSLKEKLK